jgi:hypothetical protein
LVGCQNCGYAHLSAIEEDDQYGPWSRLDRNDNQYLKLKNKDEPSFDVVVAMAGWGGGGGRIYLGSPKANKMFSIDAIERNTTDGSLSAVISENFAAEDGNNLLMGDKEGDRFGSSISTDKPGNSVVVGSERGRYVRAMMNLQKDDNNKTAL